MTTETWSYLVYGIWFLAWVALEIAGWKHKVPWFTLSETAWSLERRFAWLRLVIFAGLAILLVHIVFGFPSGTPLA